MKPLLICTFSVAIFSGCTFSVSEVNETTKTSTNIESGSSIDEKLRNQIDKKNQLVLTSLFKNDQAALDDIASKYLKNGNGLNGFGAIAEDFGSRMKAPTYTVFEEHHFESSAPLVEVKMESGLSRGADTNTFELRIKSNAEESYLSLLLHNYGDCELLVTTLYGNYEEGWKLDFIGTGILTIYGLTGTEWHYKSKNLWEEGDTVNAFLFSLLSHIATGPCPGVFAYDLGDEVKKYNEKIKVEFEEAFDLPRVMNSVGSTPEILGIGMKGNSVMTFLPWVQYTTNLSDTSAMLKERDLVFEGIHTVFPGIDKYFTTVLFDAYEKK